MAEWKQTNIGFETDINGYGVCINENGCGISKDHTLIKLLKFVPEKDITGEDTIEVYNQGEWLFTICMTEDVNENFKQVTCIIEEYVKSFSCIARAVIGGKIDLNLVHTLQDCIFETENEFQRAVFFHELKDIPKKGIYPSGIYSEVQINDNGFVSFVSWDKPNNESDIKIKEFTDFYLSSYENAIQWMTTTIESVKMEVD
jgi:hypothetical protein